MKVRLTENFSHFDQNCTKIQIVSFARIKKYLKSTDATPKLHPQRMAVSNVEKPTMQKLVAEHDCCNNQIKRLIVGTFSFPM